MLINWRRMWCQNLLVQKTQHRHQNQQDYHWHLTLLQINLHPLQSQLPLARNLRPIGFRQRSRRRILHEILWWQKNLGSLLRSHQHLFPKRLQQSPTRQKTQIISQKIAITSNRSWRPAYRQHYDQTTRSKQRRLRNFNHRLRTCFYYGRIQPPKTQLNRMELNETCISQNEK